MFWSDQYIGLPYQDKGFTRDGIDCWGLLRMVWRDQLGFEVPSFCEAVKRSSAIRGISKYFEKIPIGQEMAHDAVIMKTEIFTGKKWELSELHVGVCVIKGLVLHAQEDLLSRVDDMRQHRVSRILRPIT